MSVAIQQADSSSRFLAYSTIDCAVFAEFEFKVQPIVHPMSATVYAYEVLTQVSDCSGEQISGEDFFSQINDQFLQRLMFAQLDYYRDYIKKYDTLMSFNLPLSCLNNDHFVNNLLAVLDFPIAIEITCTQLSLSHQALAKNIKKLRHHGVEFWLDDYCHKDRSKTHALQYFTWDVIKLDKSYLLYHDNDEIINMLAELLSLYAPRLIIEGVETAIQRKMHLMEHVYMQGYYYYYPTSIDNLIPLLEEKNNRSPNSDIRQKKNRPSMSLAVGLAIE
ncbi:EAL domain-containing protein [Vibrio sp. ZSDZ65]|uniref:EAL domain-containing protein n=1 Tax=Vibrio qingdaonensis TaxID=2829491 RepID=A0A9X3CQB4_9VIBR|nr:EAL domain-containing protein [Vibrio qingdaonensis]MCW8347109.1 EAL domain-containing protein [Vibrio qingdaonensis]